MVKIIFPSDTNTNSFMESMEEFRPNDAEDIQPLADGSVLMEEYLYEDDGVVEWVKAYNGYVVF